MEYEWIFTVKYSNSSYPLFSWTQLYYGKSWQKYWLLFSFQYCPCLIILFSSFSLNFTGKLTSAIFSVEKKFDSSLHVERDICIFSWDRKLHDSKPNNTSYGDVHEKAIGGSGSLYYHTTFQFKQLCKRHWLRKTLWFSKLWKNGHGFGYISLHWLGSDRNPDFHQFSG